MGVCPHGVHLAVRDVASWGLNSNTELIHAPLQARACVSMVDITDKMSKGNFVLYLKSCFSLVDQRILKSYDFNVVHLFMINISSYICEGSQKIGMTQDPSFKI